MQDIQSQINSLVDKFKEYDEVIRAHRTGCNTKLFELNKKFNVAIKAFHSLGYKASGPSSGRSSECHGKGGHESYRSRGEVFKDPKI